MGDCKKCDGKGWLLYSYEWTRPRPAYWFNRGPDGEKPSVCEHCDTIERGVPAEEG
jgi:hypothetical protein